MPFDPYYDWLGIPADQRPVNHYTLLGLRELEPNATAIENAAERLLAFLRTKQTGDRSADSQRLLNEITNACNTLLDAKAKAKYDAGIKRLGEAPVPPSPPQALAPGRVPMEVPDHDIVELLHAGEGTPPQDAIVIEPPPHEDDANAWFYLLMGEELGPVPAYEIKRLRDEKTITFDTLIRRGKYAQWRSASQVGGLIDDATDSDFLRDLREQPVPLSPPRFLTSSGDLPYDYEPMTLVFANASMSIVGETVEAREAYRAAARRLVDNALEQQANGVVHVHFDTEIVRLGVDMTLHVFAYGTAVRMTDRGAKHWPRVDR